MQDWYVYSDDAFSVRLPRQLKIGHPVRKGIPDRLFKGKFTRSDPKSEVWVLVQPNLNSELVELRRQATAKPPRSGESNGTYYEYRYCGESKTRPFGFEYKASFTNPGGSGHHWDIAFPYEDRWVMIGIDNFAGGLTWEQLEAMGSEIIRSFQLHEAGAGPAMEPLNVAQASHNEELSSGATNVGEEEIEWFACDGGPHIVLSRSLRHRWKGVENLSDVVDPTTDYGRACAVAPPAGLISVGDGQALVMAGSPSMTGWRPSSGQTGVDLYVLDALKASGPDGLVAAALNALNPKALVDTGMRLMLKKADLILMFAGDVSGDSAYGEINIAASPGTYRILQARYQGTEGSLWIIRLVSETGR